MQRKLMNTLTYNLCLKPIVFELIYDHLKSKNSIIYSIDFRESKSIYENKLNKAIFCDQRYSKKGLDHDGNKISYNLSRNIIKSFSKIENVAYRIMSRYEKDNYSFDFKNRTNHYFDLLKFSFGLIKKYDIKKIIFFDYPHHIESYILYKVARYLKIKIIIISYLYIGEYRMVVDDRLQNRFNEFFNEKKLTNFKDSNSLYFKNISKKIKHVKPFYLVENSNYYYAIYYFVKDFYRSFLNGFFKESNNFNKKLQNINFPSEIHSSFLMFFNRLKILRLKKTYLSFCKIKPDYKKKYILFCPNLQPEASTLPMAGIYSDFEIILDTILEALPDDWVLYYKEHPLVFNLLKESYLSKSKEYYENIYNEKIQFIDYRLDTYQLIDNANLIITPTGSIGIESLIRGKRVGFFGSPWWRIFDDPIFINDYFKLKELINKSDSKTRIDNSQFYQNYIKTFEQTFPWEGFSYDSYKELLEDLKSNKLDLELISSMREYLIGKIDNIE